MALTGRSENPSRGLSVAAWALAGLSLLLTCVGIFWLRLWIPGLVLGVAAVIISLVAASRVGRRPLVTDPRVLLSAFALAVPTVVAVIALIVGLTGIEAAPERHDLQVELRVTAPGDFTVSYTEPLAPGASKATVADVDATDEFEKSFTTNLDSMQFEAVIAQNNIGPQSISCEVSINGTVVVERTGDQRYVDCSADLQQLYREGLSSSSPSP